jgi:small-conductance mechanosensitive channel
VNEQVRTYLTAAAAFVVMAGGAYGVRRLISDRLRKVADQAGSDWGRLAVDLLSSVGLVEILLLALFVATRGLPLHPSADKVLRIGVVAVLGFRAVTMLQRLLGFWLTRYVEPVEADPTTRAAIRNLRWIGNAALWAAGGLFVLANLGIDVSTLITGLGVGGIAVALAAQAILGDLFSSFAIFMDKPFRVGDSIAVDGLMGTVEQIGIKTTRVRSIDGELLVFANSDLTKSRIRNYGLMERRRVALNFEVAPDTKVEKLKAVPRLAKAIVEAQDLTKLDRVHFKQVATYGLEFELVFFVESADYKTYMDQRQRVMLSLLEVFGKEDIRFAYPAAPFSLPPRQ